MISPKSIPTNKSKMSPKNSITKPLEHSPRHFHATYPIKSKPDALHSFYRMSQLPSHCPKIAGCYQELLADPSLVSTFPVDEWMSINELPCLSALDFTVVWEELVAKLVTPKVWSQAWVDFTTHSGKKAHTYIGESGSCVLPPTF